MTLRYALTNLGLPELKSSQETRCSKRLFSFPVSWSRRLCPYLPRFRKEPIPLRGPRSQFCNSQPSPSKPSFLERFHLNYTVSHFLQLSLDYSVHTRPEGEDRFSSNASDPCANRLNKRNDALRFGFGSKRHQRVEIEIC